MDNPASTADLEALWRPLTAEEQPVAESLLNYAWAKLQTRSYGLVDRITAGTVPVETVVFVLCQAVLRVMRNPEGRRQGARSLDDFSESWTLDDTVAAGSLYFTDDELLDLVAVRVRRSSFSIVPGGY